MIEHSQKDIDKVVYDILKKSKAFGVFPTPVDEIVKYCELNLNNTADFHTIPNNYISKKVDVLRKALRKVYGALDRREKIIYLDPTLKPKKKNFVKLHEVGHNVLPWQNPVDNFLDDKLTLNHDTKELYEAEANYFASASLFQQDRFIEELKKLPLELPSAIQLAGVFGASAHATFRRYAEHSHKKCALLVLEKPEIIDLTFPLVFRNYFPSVSFTKSFGEIQWPDKFSITYPFIVDYGRRRLHKDGSIALPTENGVTNFEYHFFDNTYNVFVLLIPPGEENKVRTKIVFTGLS